MKTSQRSQTGPFIASLLALLLLYIVPVHVNAAKVFKTHVDATKVVTGHYDASVPLNPNSYLRLCNFPSRANSFGGFGAAEFVPGLCTHVVVPVTLRANEPFRLRFDIPAKRYVDGWYSLFRFRAVDPELKAVFTLDVEDAYFDEVLKAKQEIVNEFINEIVDFALDKSFDGMELRWTEYEKKIGKHKKKSHDEMMPAHKFFQAVRKVLDTRKVDRKRFEVFVRVSGSLRYLHDAVDEERLHGTELGAAVDYMTLEAFHLYGAQPKLFDAWYGAAFTNNNFHKVIDRWLRVGFPRDKIIVGIALEAHGVKPTPDALEKSVLALMQKGKQAANAVLPFKEFCKRPTSVPGFGGIFRVGEKRDKPRTHAWAGTELIDIYYKVKSVSDRGLAGFFVESIYSDAHAGDCPDHLKEIKFPALTLARFLLTGKKMMVHLPTEAEKHKPYSA